MLDHGPPSRSDPPAKWVIPSHIFRIHIAPSAGVIQKASAFRQMLRKEKGHSEAGGATLFGMEPFDRLNAWNSKRFKPVYFGAIGLTNAEPSPVGKLSFLRLCPFRRETQRTKGYVLFARNPHRPSPVSANLSVIAEQFSRMIARDCYSFAISILRAIRAGVESREIVNSAAPPPPAGQV